MTFEPNERFKDLLTILKSEAFDPTSRSQTDEYKEFIRDFPVDRLLSLTLDEYCIGKQLRSFCWWIERGLEPVFGRYVPGGSKGHIISFVKENGSVRKVDRLSALTDEEALRYTLKIQHLIASADISVDFSWIDDDNELYRRVGVEPHTTMSDSRKLRILCCYNPDQFLPINSPDNLGHFLELFGCPKKEIPKESQPVARYMLLHELYTRAKKEFPNISPRNFVDVLYRKEFAPPKDERKDGAESQNDGPSLSGASSYDDKLETHPALNRILYGPPGTGKTFATIDEAVKILVPQFYESNKNNRTVLKDKFDDFVAKKRIRFVTFHQSFSYEDFVEGLRADTDDSEGGQIQYSVEPGVFKEICDDANKPLQNLSAEVRVSDTPRIWKISIDVTGESVTRQHCLTHDEARIGWGRVGNLKDAQLNDPAFKLGSNDINTLDSFANRIAVGDVLLCIGSSTEVTAVGIVNGAYRFDDTPPIDIKADYKHVLPVSWVAKDVKFSILNVNGQKRFTQKTIYEIKRFSWSELFDGLRSAKIDVQAVGSTAMNADPFVLIIDEINRGNISRIFGELITLIEPSKRLGASEALTVTLPYSKKSFGVPKNVYLIGTMNTADKSLTSLDIALRRRFVFKEMPVKYELLNTLVIEKNDKKVNVGEMLLVMNQRIEVLLDKEHCIGHAYFLPLMSDPTLDGLTAVFKQQILPLLQEYFFEDWERIGLVLNDHSSSSSARFIHNASEVAKSVTQLFSADLVDKFKLRETRWSVNESALTSIDSYRNIAGATE